MESEDDNKRYGWLSWRPSGLQKMNKMVVFLVFMCLANNFQSLTVNGLVGVVLSSIEKRFGFSSLQSSWIYSAYDAASIPILLFVSYVGNRGNRPKWTAVGLLILAIGTVLFFLPHFISGVYRPVNRALENNLCRNRTGENECEGVKTANEEARLYPLFIVGRILSGFGATPLYTICVTFMDDQVSKETFSVFVAIFYAFGVFGPALGFIVGGYLLNVYTDFHSIDAKKELGLTPDDPRWVGAWWMGFFVSAIVIFLCAIPLSGYPYDLPGSSEIRAKKKTEAYKAKPEDEDTSGNISYLTLKELPQILKGLFTNPTYICLSLYIATDGFIIGGFTAFGPKYVENQYAVAAGFAGMIFGLITIPGGAGGTVLGGLIIKKFKLKVMGIIRTEMICTGVILVLTFCLFIICQPVKFAGITTRYNSTIRVENMPKNLSAECNLGCQCQNVPFDPICSHRNIRYYSPCHAGCDAMRGLATKEYFNCSCIPTPARPGQPDATSNVCSTDNCNALPLFVVMLFFAMLCIFICSGLNISATVRCVPVSQRSMAIAVQWIFLRLLGSIPGPVVFGFAFDRACELWEERCQSRGSCQGYSNFKMSLYMWIVVFSIKVVSMTVLFLAQCAYKPPLEQNSELQKVYSRDGLEKYLDGNKVQPEVNYGFKAESKPKVDSKIDTHESSQL